MLNKLERKLDIHDIMQELKIEKMDGIFDWLHLVSRIDDTQVARLCGTDSALYLTFLRYSSNMFRTISLLNLFFIVLFLTGSPLADDNFRIDH